MFIWKLMFITSNKKVLQMSRKIFNNTETWNLT